jgi:diacylglycerol kinase family enzyme
MRWGGRWRSAPRPGIVPAGSGNGLARELGIPFSPRKALAHALVVPARQIDAAEIEGRLFFNVTGIGLDAHVAERGAASTMHTVACGSTSPPSRMSCSPTSQSSIPSKPTRKRLSHGADGSGGERGGNTAMGDDCFTAVLSDGELDLVVIEDRGVLGNLVRLPFLITGGLHAGAASPSAG